MKCLTLFPALAFILFFQVNANAQNCKLTCPSNIVIKADSNKEGATVSYAPATMDGDCGTISYSRASGSFFRLGSHSIIVTTNYGHKCAFTIMVTDNESPNLSNITLSKGNLWPANNKMKKVNVYYTASDNAEQVKTVLSVSSNDTAGEKDWEIIDDHLLRLKASRLADGSPRIYSIKVTATDEAGNKTTRTTSIAVSNTMKAISVL